MAATTRSAATQATPSRAARPERPTPPSTGRAPRKFPLFPHLPAEIRLAIWRFGFPGPRLVVLRPRQTTVLAPGAAPQYLPWYTSPTRPPAALHVCREARAECLATYPVLFGTTTTRDDDDDDDDENHDPSTAAAAGLLGGVVFSPARDVLYLGGGGGGGGGGATRARLQIQGFLGAAAATEDLARVRRAAVDGAALWDERLAPALAAAGAAACLAGLAAAMPALQHLAVVVGGGIGRDANPLLDSSRAAAALVPLPRCADLLLRNNVHRALALLGRDPGSDGDAGNDDDDDEGAAAAAVATFPAWDLMAVAAVASLPQHAEEAAAGEEVPAPAADEDGEDDGPWTLGGFACC